MRTRNKPVLIFFCLLLSAAAVLSGVNIYSELKNGRKKKRTSLPSHKSPSLRSRQHRENQSRPSSLRQSVIYKLSLQKMPIASGGSLLTAQTSVIPLCTHRPIHRNISAETFTASTAKAVCRSLTGGAISKAPTSLSTVIICETAQCLQTLKSMWTESF